jgi:colanic acid/amylovoran biosynthesis protein
MLQTAILVPDGKAARVRPHRVILTGTYNSRNKGDAAMQIAMSSALTEHFGEAAQIEICSPFPDIDQPFYAPLPVEFDDRRRLIRGSLGVLAGPLHRRFAEADLVIDLSGDMLTEDYGPHVAWSHFLPLLRARAAKTPYFVCAQSIGPFKHTLPIARRVLAGAEAVTVRDAISLEYLREIGIPAEKLRQTADMAFLLPAAARDASMALIRETGLDPARSIVIVSLSRLIARRYDARCGAGAFVEIMARELAAFAETHGVQLLFVAHVTGPGESKDDRIISREVLAKISHPDCALLDLDARPETLKGAIACCAAVIGCRMHANIAGLSSTVPVLALAYSHKTPGIMQACGLGDMVLDVDAFGPDDIRVAAARLIGERDDLAVRMAGPVAAQKDAARENLAIAVRLLEGAA